MSFIITERIAPASIVPTSTRATDVDLTEYVAALETSYADPNGPAGAFVFTVPGTEKSEMRAERIAFVRAYAVLNARESGKYSPHALQIVTSAKNRRVTVYIDPTADKPRGYSLPKPAADRKAARDARKAKKVAALREESERLQSVTAANAVSDLDLVGRLPNGEPLDPNANGETDPTLPGSVTNNAATDPTQLPAPKSAKSAKKSA